MPTATLATQLFGRAYPITPRRVRPPGPYQHQNGTERHNVIVAYQEDNDNRRDADRPESAQDLGDMIAGWRSAWRFARGLNNLCRRFRLVTAHHSEIPLLPAPRLRRILQRLAVRHSVEVTQRLNPLVTFRLLTLPPAQDSPFNSWRRVPLWLIGTTRVRIDTPVPPRSPPSRNFGMQHPAGAAGSYVRNSFLCGLAPRLLATWLLSFTRPSARRADLRRADGVHYFPSGRPWRRARETN